MLNKIEAGFNKINSLLGLVLEKVSTAAQVNQQNMSASLSETRGMQRLGETLLRALSQQTDAGSHTWTVTVRAILSNKRGALGVVRRRMFQQLLSVLQSVAYPNSVTQTAEDFFLTRRPL